MINFDKQYKKSGIPWIGDVPVDWEATKLKNIAKLVNGYAFKSDLYSENGVFIVRITNVDDEKLNTNSPVYYPFNRLKEFRGNLLKENDILMTLTGNVGLVGIVDKQYPKAALNQRVGCIRTKKVSNKFLFYLFATDVFRKHAILNADGTAQLNLSTDWLMSNKLFVPQLSKQQQIVNYLDKKVGIIDKLIENIKQQIEDLKQCKINLITETVTKGLNKTAKLKTVGLKWCNTIAEDFRIGIIRADFTLRGRIGWQGLTTNDYVEEGPYLITGTDFENEQINWNTCVHITDKRYDEDANIHVRENDLLITKDGTVGKLAIVKNSPKKVSLNSGIMLIKPRTNRCLTSYLKYVLSSSVFWDWYYFSQRGKATIQHLYQEQFSYFKYPLPDIITQQHIVAYLDKKCDTINRLLQNKRQKIEELKEYKKSLIYECVTGKKEVL